MKVSFNVVSQKSGVSDKTGNPYCIANVIINKAPEEAPYLYGQYFPIFCDSFLEEKLKPHVSGSCDLALLPCKKEYANIWFSANYSSIEVNN